MPSPTVPPELRVALGSRLTLATPVMAASGGFGYGDEVCDLADTAVLGALITPTITMSPRAGNPMPRTAETSAGLLHSLGWPNPGLTCFLSELLPRMQTLPCHVLVSIYGDTAEEWQSLTEALDSAGGVSGLELNLSTASLNGEAVILRRIRDSVRTVRSVTRLPLIVKLPSANVEIGAAASAAVEEGADVVAVSQGFLGVAVRLSSRKFRLPGVSGDLSGPCIKPLALYQVWRVAESVACPIVASGGIMTGEDALEFLVAGASAVAVGVASSIHPTAIARITNEISAYLTHHNVPAVSDLVGVARCRG